METRPAKLSLARLIEKSPLFHIGPKDIEENGKCEVSQIEDLSLYGAFQIHFSVGTCCGTLYDIDYFVILPSHHDHGLPMSLFKYEIQ
jgi:hypothetical protein